MIIIIIVVVAVFLQSLQRHFHLGRIFILLNND